jgi:hypothetical protein
MITIAFAVPDLAAAGAAASLIFLISFALAHWTSILSRLRGGPPREGAFRTRWFPAVPVIGGIACATLAIFQAIAVPAAGSIALLWLGLGVLLYLGLFSERARTVDALAEASDPTLARLRGKVPLILVPIANPESAPGLVAVASAMAPVNMGRVLLLTVMVPDRGPDPVTRAQEVLGQALRASLEAGQKPEALLTLATAQWDEIVRVAKTHRCEGLLLGRAGFDDDSARDLEYVMNGLDCDVTFLSAPPGWNLDKAHRILVPVGGRGEHSELRARLLGALGRAGPRTVVWLRVLPQSATDDELEDARTRVARFARDMTLGEPELVVERASDITAKVVEHANRADLLVLGLRRPQGGRRVFGDAVPRIASQARCATIVISRGS